jgi:hypothetical protein
MSICNGGCALSGSSSNPRIARNSWPPASLITRLVSVSEILGGFAGPTVKMKVELWPARWRRRSDKEENSILLCFGTFNVYANSPSSYVLSARWGLHSSSGVAPLGVWHSRRCRLVRAAGPCGDCKQHGCGHGGPLSKQLDGSQREGSFQAYLLLTLALYVDWGAPLPGPPETVGLGIPDYWICIGNAGGSFHGKYYLRSHIIIAAQHAFLECLIDVISASSSNLRRAFYLKQ